MSSKEATKSVQVPVTVSAPVVGPVIASPLMTPTPLSVILENRRKALLASVERKLTKMANDMKDQNSAYSQIVEKKVLIAVQREAKKAASAKIKAIRAEIKALKKAQIAARKGVDKTAEMKAAVAGRAA